GAIARPPDGRLIRLSRRVDCVSPKAGLNGPRNPALEPIGAGSYHRDTPADYRGQSRARDTSAGAAGTSCVPSSHATRAALATPARTGTRAGSRLPARAASAAAS